MSHFPPRFIPSTALALVTLIAVSSDVRAQDTAFEGVPAGPWILTPLVAAQFGYDSNPFYASSDAGATGERNSRFSLGLGAALPFRQSGLNLGVRRDRLRYEKTQLNEDTVDELEGELGLRFASSDTVALRTSWTRGIADTLRFDPGGETVFRGDPYRYREVSAAASREADRRWGYFARLTRRDLMFPDDDVGVDYFEYRGWDLEGEYRQPIRGTMSATLSYAGRRFEHYCNTVAPSGEPCPGVGEPFRDERGDAGYVGVRGTFAAKSPFWVRLGWLDLRYGGAITKGYSGPVGEANVRVAVGSGAFVEGILVRQVYSSFYENNNYFRYDSAQGRFGVNWANRWEVAVALLYARTRYDTPSSGLPAAPRRDDTLRAEAYANLFLPRRFGIRFTVTDERRDSNVVGLDFDRRTFLVGAFFGWL